MKCFTIFGACLLIAAVAKIYSQNVDGDPVKELDKIIAEKDFTIKIFRMISNPYNVKALDKGKGFIELTGYRLAEVLHILSKESKIIVQVKSIQKIQLLPLELNLLPILQKISGKKFLKL